MIYTVLIETADASFRYQAIYSSMDRSLAAKEAQDIFGQHRERVIALIPGKHEPFIVD